MSVLYGTNQPDNLTGGEGNDLLQGWPAGDRLASAIDHDSLYGMGGHDTMLGGSGHDVVWGGLGNDRIFGGAGRDQLDGGDGNDWVYGGAGRDLFIDGNANGFDRLFGGVGNDLFSIGFGTSVFVDGGRGVDHINLGLSHLSKSLRLDFAQSARLQKFEGNVSMIRIESGLVTSGSGNDHLSGGKWSDSFYGGLGNDRLIGRGGDDTLSGGFGDDTIFGGAGKDTFRDFQGSDRLEGGAGADDFVFSDVFGNGGTPFIVDFKSGVDDLHIGRGVAFGMPEGDVSADAFHIGKVAADAQDRFIYDMDTGRLYFDNDGTGSFGANVLVARFQLGTALQAGDFFIFNQ